MSRYKTAYLNFISLVYRVRYFPIRQVQYYLLLTINSVRSRIDRDKLADSKYTILGFICLLVIELLAVKVETTSKIVVSGLLQPSVVLDPSLY